MFILLLVTLATTLVNGEECSMENILCSLCGKRQNNSNDELAALRQGIEELKQRMTPVAFFAYRGSNLATGSSLKHQIIIYDIVDLNIGNGYNKNTGRFVAPVSGLYLFHVTTGVNDKSWTTVELILDGQVTDIAFPDSGNHDDRNQVTTATPLDLTKGDEVYVRIGIYNGGNYIESNQSIRTSFSAVKIQ